MIYDYIKAALSHIQISEKEDSVSVTLSPIPGFEFITEKKENELLIIEFKDYLYNWIISRKKAGEFIPLINRIDLNEERTIKGFDQTIEENINYLNSLTPPDTIKIEIEKIKEIKNA
jgi:hypothetical protein